MSGRNVWIGLACIVGLLGLAMTAQANLVALPAQSPAGVNLDAYGWSVGVSGDTAVVGSPAIWDTSSNGSAQVFVRQGDGTWAHQSNLAPVGGYAAGGVGMGVSIDGDRAVVGVRDAAEGVYVFERSGTTWAETASFTSALQRFGNSVDIDGDHLVVGTNKSSTALWSHYSGGAWSDIAAFTLDPGVGTASGELGYDVAVRGDLAIAGAFTSNAAQIWRWDDSGETWVHEKQLSSGSGAFGIGVDIDGDTAVVGARDDNMAYVYRYNGTDDWTLEQAIAGDANSMFGSKVAIEGDTLVVGAYGQEVTAGETTYGNAGAAYIYQRSGTTWSLAETLVEPTPLANQSLGAYVAIDGSTVVMGGPARDGNHTPGVAYAYTIPEPSTLSMLVLLAALGMAWRRLGWGGTGSASVR